MSVAYTEGVPVIEAIHPKVAEFYRQNNLEYTATTLDQLKHIFDTVTQGNPVERRINSMTRVRKGNSEYIYTEEDLISTDSSGNERIFNHKNYKYELPHPHKEYSQSENAFVVTSIERYITEYELPFSKENLKDLLQYCSDDTGYT